MPVTGPTEQVVDSSSMGSMGSVIGASQRMMMMKRSSIIINDGSSSSIISSSHRSHLKIDYDHHNDHHKGKGRGTHRKGQAVSAWVQLRGFSEDSRCGNRRLVHPSMH